MAQDHWNTYRFDVIRILVLSVICAVNPIAAQTGSGTVVGEVFDGMTGESLVGALVIVVNEEMEYATDDNGHFLLSDRAMGRISVRVESPGYITRVEPVDVENDGVSFVHFRMSSLSLLLDELKVVADRNRDENRTAMLGDIIPRESESTLTVMRLLTARVPSMTVLGGNYSAAGTPEIRIRGQGSMTVSNTPSIYLDGVRVSSQVLTEIFAVDVEWVRVLKGPSAVSMYPDAVNGVILVESKRR
jgi:hypothetical protein